MVDTRFATTQVDARRRLDSWRDALAHAFGPFEVHAGQGAGVFAGSLRYARRANLQFNDLHYQGQKLERTRGNVSQLDEEFYTFGMPLAGPLAVTAVGQALRGRARLCLSHEPERALSGGGARAWRLS